MIHWPTVEQLRNEVGAEEFVEVLQIFFEEVSETFAQMRADPDRAQLERNLHFLKGSAVSLGFQTFSRLCQDGERMSASGSAGAVDLDAIVTAFEESRSAFHADLARHV
ncbi:Hpt domain-containing protein [Ruegeria sediminis]|uniref:Hpt domain-containing protein n=1 Tax=Ruegeria sediminis TaxID=2583820 RepID=A0ABY2WWP8_9RHOB|nr:Hpt domain-containing protein [Ruegeria sediminis]TMV07178.1 Hpt domain-containing protein [Ruegeria sediminis]